MLIVVAAAAAAECSRATAAAAAAESVLASCLLRCAVLASYLRLCTRELLPCSRGRLVILVVSRAALGFASLLEQCWLRALLNINYIMEFNPLI